MQNTPGVVLASKVKQRLATDPDLKDMKVLVKEVNGTQLKTVTNWPEVGYLQVKNTYF